MKKGFTLIELLVVIAVLGILSAGVFTAINPLKRIQQANDAKIKGDIGQIAQAMQAYYTASSATGINNVPYYPRAVSDLAPTDGTGDLKVEPKIPPANTAPYNVTGANKDGSACTTAGKDCVNVTVWALLNETGAGYWCWQSSTATIKLSTSAPVATTAVTCP